MRDDDSELERVMNLWGHALALRDNGISGTPFEGWQYVSALCDRLWMRAVDILSQDAEAILYDGPEQPENDETHEP